MSMHRIILIATFITVIVLSACAQAPDPSVVETLPPTSTNGGKVIVLGDISDDPGEVIEGSQPLATYLAGQLAEFGYTAGRVVVAQTADEMIELLTRGEVDLYFDSVYPAMLISDASGAQPILRRWRFGVAEYSTIIFARTDSGITALDDLSGKMVAFDNPYSTSGFVMPALTMIENGLMLTGKSTHNEAVAPDEVGFVFSYDDENTLEWVRRGFVAAGATDDYRFNVMFPGDAREDLVVLAETDSLPRQVVVARAGLDEDLLAAIVRVLVSVDESEEGQQALEAFQTTEFDEFPEGLDAALEEMRSIREIIDGIKMP